MAFDWRQAKVGGGGGINAVASSDDGSVILSGGDISTMHRSMDDGAYWENANKGLYDGGENGVIGGITFREGSTTHALMGNKAGVWITTDANDTCDWTRVGVPTVEFGTGGNSRPRPGTGGLADSSGDYSFIIAKNGTVYRYNWATSTFGTLSAVTGIGEGLACDPSDPDLLYATSSSGVWKFVNATTSGASTKLTNGPGGNDIAFGITSTGSKYLFVADPGAGIKRTDAFTTSPATGIAFSQVKSAGMLLGAQWSAVVAGTLPSGDIRVAVSCGGAPVGAGTTAREHGWITDDGNAATPTWTCFTLDDANYALYRNADNDPIEINGVVNWNYLPRARGGNAGYGCLANTENSGSEHVTEDMHMERNNPDRIWIGGRQGCWLLDVAAATLYPSMGSLGVQANGPVLVDPNSTDHVYVMNTDHIVIGTTDTGDTWRKNESNSSGAGGASNFGGETAGFDMSIETGVSISHCFLAHGMRNMTGRGGIYYHDNPMDFSDWVSCGFTGCDGDLGDATPSGVLAYRASFEGVTRRIVFVAQEGIGFRRGILTTAVPPAPFVHGSSQLTTLTGSPALSYNGTGKAEWCPILRLTDDRVVMWNRMDGGIYYCRNARTAGIPSCTLMISDTSADANRGEGYMCMGADSDTLFVSFADGANEGVWRYTGWDTATNAAGLTRTAVTPPVGSFSRPGPLAYANIAGTGQRLFVVDNRAADNNGSGSAAAKAYLSTNATATALTDISGDYFDQLLHKCYAADMSAEGRIYISQQGPGVLVYEDVAPPVVPGAIEVFDPAADLATTTAGAVHNVAFDATAYAEDDMLVVFTHSGDGDGANVPVITDTVGTTGGWTTRESELFNTSGKHLAVHTAVLGATPLSGNIICTYADSQTGAGASMLVVRNYVAVGQTISGTATSATPTVSFASAIGQSSVVLAAVADKVEAISMTWPAGFTESYEGGFATPNQGMSVAYDIEGAPQAVGPVAGLASNEWAMVAIELTGLNANTDISWVEMQTPELAAATLVSFVEMEVPQTTAEVEVSYVEGEFPAVAVGETEVSWVRMDVPDVDADGGGGSFSSRNRTVHGTYLRRNR